MGEQGSCHVPCDPTDTDETNANNHLQSRIDNLADRLVAMEKTNRQLELDNETLAFKVVASYGKPFPISNSRLHFVQ